MNSIYKLRKEMGLSQQEFAHLFLVNKSTVSRWENNKRHMNKKNKYIFEILIRRKDV